MTWYQAVSTILFRPVIRSQPPPTRHHPAAPAQLRPWKDLLHAAAGDSTAVVTRVVLTSEDLLTIVVENH